MNSPNTGRVEIDIPLQWREVRLSNGEPFLWHQKAAKYERDRDQLRGPQVYRWVLKDAKGVEQSRYIGESGEFLDRVAGYRNGRVSDITTEQALTEDRVRQAMHRCEQEGGTVELWFLDVTTAPCRVNGMTLNKLALGEKYVRLMLENLAILTDRQNRVQLLNDLPENTIEKKLLKIVKALVGQKGASAAMESIQRLLRSNETS